MNQTNDRSTSSDPSSKLHQTPLYQLHLDYKARLTSFAGWEMPIQYSSIKAEHQAVRQTSGMFDISHMGKFELLGTDVRQQLQTLVPSNLAQLTPGKAQYTVLLNADGGILDDLIVYYHGLTPDGSERITLIVNAATTEADRQWLLSQLQLSSEQFRDWSAQLVLIAIQGPEAVAKLQPLVEGDLATISRFGHGEFQVQGHPAFFARTGYTGEDGFEIMLDPEPGQALWRSLLDAGVTPCGLGCRDTLRLEAAMALYGQDIDQTTSPLEAGLSWLVHLDGTGNFMGRSHLEAQKANGVSRRLVGLQMEGRNIARHGYSVLHEGQVVGEITSGTLSPTLGYPIALAYVPTELSKVGRSLSVEIRGKQHPATVVKRPFYKSPHLKK